MMVSGNGTWLSAFAAADSGSRLARKELIVASGRKGRKGDRSIFGSREDEFVYVLEGELSLIEDGGESVLRAGDCAAFPKGTGNGHHLVNRGTTTALYLEVGSRHPDDLTTCSDIDMMSANADGRFVHKDGSPYPGR